MEWKERIFPKSPYTPVCNVTGQPAISLPLFWTDANVPIAIQIAGKVGCDSDVFAIAGQFERARNCHNRYRILWI